MQHATHETSQTKRFFINTRGELVDRSSATHRRTGYSITASNASRSEMQLLADMLNEPAHQSAYDNGEDPTWKWAARIADYETAMFPQAFGCPA
jgi:hypothetical protein